MTDRHTGYIVTLAKDIREDDAEATLTALRQVKGVLSVDPIIDEGMAVYNGTMRERRRVLDLLWKLIEDVQPRG